MVAAAFLSAIHLLTMALGAGAIFARAHALSRPLDDDGWKRLLAADNAWGIAALLWIGSGLLRVFYGGKDAGFYSFEPESHAAKAPLSHPSQPTPTCESAPRSSCWS
jgi:uncharacterized membrane protein